jgi:hypothetical protein
MSTGDALRDLQAFLDNRWAVAQPRFYPGAAEGPRVPPEVTASEAGYFLASVATEGLERPLFNVDDDRKLRSDRSPPRADGAPRGFFFFEGPGRVRLETIVHMAAMARLEHNFGWPREHMIFESPDLLKDGRVVLRREALDILLLEAPCKGLAAKMTVTAARSRVGIEAKANAKLLSKLLDELRACQTASVPRSHSQHKKCLAIAGLQPRFFLGVAAAQTWRLFTVVERGGRAVLGDELPNLDDLHFSSMSELA